MFRVWLAGRRTRRHPGQRHQAHQALHVLAVDDVPLAPENDHHPAAAVERPARVFLVDQAHQQQVFLRRPVRRVAPVEARPRHLRQLALPRDRELTAGVDPAHSERRTHSPDFFLSQSSSIFKRPISPYSRSESACDAGFGPRLPSNSVAACCTISLRVFTPRTASIPTFALNSALWTLRLLTSAIL